MVLFQNYKVLQMNHFHSQDSGILISIFIIPPTTKGKVLPSSKVALIKSIPLVSKEAASI